MNILSGIVHSACATPAPTNRGHSFRPVRRLFHCSGPAGFFALCLAFLVTVCPTFLPAPALADDLVFTDICRRGECLSFELPRDVSIMHKTEGENEQFVLAAVRSPNRLVVEIREYRGKEDLQRDVNGSFLISGVNVLSLGWEGDTYEVWGRDRSNRTWHAVAREFEGFARSDYAIGLPTPPAMQKAIDSLAFRLRPRVSTVGLDLAY